MAARKRRMVPDWLTGDARGIPRPRERGESKNETGAYTETRA